MCRSMAGGCGAFLNNAATLLPKVQNDEAKSISNESLRNYLCDGLPRRTVPGQILAELGLGNSEAPLLAPMEAQALDGLTELCGVEYDGQHAYSTAVRFSLDPLHCLHWKLPQGTRHLSVGMCSHLTKDG